MRPPISYPDGRIIREEPENDSQETSVLVRWSFLSLFRLQLKGAMLLPLIWLGFAVVQSCVIWVNSSLSAFDEEERATLFSNLLVCMCVILILVMLFCAILPFQYAFLKLIRGPESLFTITPKEVRDVAKRFPIFISWKRVLFIRQWSGDLLIITFGGGILIPREAFHASIEAEHFIYTARQFHRLARESKCPQK